MTTPLSITCSCGKVFTAKDANGDINPAEVKAAVDKLINTLNEGSAGIITALRKIEPDAEKAYVQNESKTLVPAIEDACSSIDKVLKQSASTIENENLYAKAVQKHDDLQAQYNDDASASAQQCAASHEDKTQS